MLLIGVNRSPFTRRVAITLIIYGIPFGSARSPASATAPMYAAGNPLGRIPALVLDSGETLIDSGAIVDHLDEVYGRDRPLAPRRRRRPSRGVEGRGTDDGSLREVSSRCLRA